MMTEQLKQEVACYGMTEQEMEQNRKATYFTDVETVAGYMAYAMSILSDVQHMLETDPSRKYGGIEPRQYINQAKYWMSRASRLG